MDESEKLNDAEVAAGEFLAKELFGWTKRTGNWPSGLAWYSPDHNDFRMRPDPAHDGDDFLAMVEKMRRRGFYFEVPRRRGGGYTAEFHRGHPLMNKPNSGIGHSRKLSEAAFLAALGVLGWKKP